MKYSIKVTRPDGAISYLSHHDKTAWHKATALRFAREYVAAHGGRVTVTPAEQLSNGQWY